MTTTDIDEAKDWRGAELDCAQCVHRALAEQGRCALQRACVQDRYARRIDRFFAWNPALADRHLTHPYFEVRAVAAKYASLFRLPGLLSDPDETVRWSAVARLPRRFLLRLREDPDREVRIRVARRLDGADLILMMHDPDYYVRQIVAEQITPSLLPLMIHDADPEVRRILAQRIGHEWLMPLAADPDARVRIVVAQRLPVSRLSWLLNDPDWRVRYELCGRLDPDQLGPLREDPDPLVREGVRERVRALAEQRPAAKASDTLATVEEC